MVCLQVIDRAYSDKRSIQSLVRGNNAVREVDPAPVSKRMGSTVEKDRDTGQDVRRSSRLSRNKKKNNWKKRHTN